MKIFQKRLIINIILILCGSFILAFGIYNIHSISPVTEGGVIGLTLLLDHFFSVSPAISNILITVLCYLIGIKVLGRKFIFYSIISALSYSVFYSVLELFPRAFPEISNHPLICALLGAVFVGIGSGLCVRAGGAPTGDDALAMSLSFYFSKDIRLFYIISDLVVLLLTATYIPLSKLIYSFITVIISGQILGIVSKNNS